MPYWVQMEFAPQGKNTAAYQLDLEQVSRVHIRRENKRLEGLTIHYGTEPPFGVDRVVALQFLDYWNEFINSQAGGLKHLTPEADPGKIDIATKIQPGILSVV